MDLGRKESFATSSRFEKEDWIAPKGDISLAEDFDISTAKGLSEAEAAELQKQFGYNELPQSKPRSIFAIALEVIKEPMFLLLVAGSLVYFILGDLQEALMLMGFVFVVMGITLYQERKTERALEALRDLSSPRALVIRDSVHKRIPGREVVPGDLIVLSEGDRVPADAELLFCTNLSADESLLTGESVSVRKVCSDGSSAMTQPGGDDLPFVYSGSLIVQGQGAAQVLATGAQTQIGKIGKALQNVESEKTPLQKETSKLVQKLALAGTGSLRLGGCGLWHNPERLAAGTLGRYHHGHGRPAGRVSRSPDHLPGYGCLEDLSEPGPHTPGPGRGDAGGDHSALH